MSEQKELIGRLFGGAGPRVSKDLHTPPLRVGDDEGPNLSVGRDRLSDSADLRLHAVEGRAWAGVDAELDHDEAVLEEGFPEVPRALALDLGLNGKIKEDEDPSHAELREEDFLPLGDQARNGIQSKSAFLERSDWAKDST